MKTVEELRKLNREELIQLKSENLQNLNKVKLSLKLGDVKGENVNMARELKKENARISTIINELGLIESLKEENKDEEN